ncbi:hypothetical protein SAMN05444487_10518 [Marininema mesophilum]|uniref:Uncharacterized protein n=1 Tax=Marininema mesophilum TaxID=1048340 RepID=A0A1H2V7P8_9BACL|nr:hypothetical protein [Marininema mesophilum]SDW64357.1 hypothetical protein SAMN05444487_10518 [Marininema mesophilum]
MKKSRFLIIIAIIVFACTPVAFGPDKLETKVVANGSNDTSLPGSS